MVIDGCIIGWTVCTGDHRGFFRDMMRLERGVEVRVGGKICLLWGRLANIVADFPAANWLAGNYSMSAVKSCRICLLAKGDFGKRWKLDTEQKAQKTKAGVKKVSFFVLMSNK